MSTDLKAQGVSYATADQSYFEKRALKRSAGFWGIWGIGIAAVISGDFSGWNAGITSAGWGGLLIASAIVVVMFFGMIFSIGEMSAAMPHTGGAYSFARASMGPWGGFITGLAETLEYVLTTAAVVYFSAGYADAIFHDLTGVSLPQQVWWAILYVVFIGLNSLGSSVSFRFALVVALISLAVLVAFGLLAVFSGKLDFAGLFDVKPDAGQTAFLPHGVLPIFFALPFGVWLFLGIEELPLSAEEAHNPTKDIPKASVWGLVTLIVCGAIVLILNPAVVGGAKTGASAEPLLDGFRAIIPDDRIAAILSAFALVGLLASLQGIMFAAGRNMYSLSRAGYYPRGLSVTGKRQTPVLAILVASVIGFAALVAAELSTPGGGGGLVLNIAVWGAVVSYMLQMASFVLLRRKYPRAKRPYHSPWGLAGAWIAGIIGLAIFVGEILNPALWSAIVIMLIVYAVGIVAFATVGRKNLVLAPEEEYALSGGLHRDPQEEGLHPSREAGVMEQERAESIPTPGDAVPDPV
ncbi:amino acid permease [Frondihabitans australicus]|uniref:Ethanolamine:proton symporter (EAT family) n=1 Tax=Frondihabitans australicus TaxID=386892 RepID=A0A495IKU4_9MICO|nr:amino acid permease [Frondihabitans australicus]RKR76622.1 ethanolamine:proton symporter (EAT family) [Frondihabitans australicus]